MLKAITLVVVVASLFLCTPVTNGQMTTPTSSVTEVKITAESVEEVRFANLDSKINPPRVKPELKVAIRIAGAPVAKARRCSFPEITKAIDDTGKDLMPKDILKGGPRRNYYNANPQKDELYGPNGYPLAFRLAASSRGAKKISLINGTIALIVGGDITEVNWDKIGGEVETEVAHPALAAAAVKVKVLPLTKTSNGGTVKVVATGSWELLLDAGIVDSSGKSVGSVSQSQQKDGSYTWTLPVKSLEGSKLRLTLVSNAQIVEAPMNLTDVRLP